MKNMIKYSFIQGFFWMLFCSCYGYITFYLERHGFTTGQIGLVTAISGLLGAGFQSVFGHLVDNKKASWKFLTMIVLSGNILAGILLIFVKIKMLQGILFGCTIFCTNSIMPLINRASFMCQTPDQKINFGVARGIGSLSYALLSLILGRLTVKISEVCVPLATILVTCFMEIALFVMPKGNLENLNNTTTENLNENQKVSIFTFIKKHPEFFIIWILCLMQMTFHNLANNYLIKICQQAGGNSGTLGVALAISAILELPVMFCFTLINKHISSKKLLFISGLAFIVKGILYILSGNIQILFAAQSMQCVSFAIYASASVYYADEAVSPEYKTTAQAFMSNSQTIGSVIGSLAGGILIQKVNLQFALIIGVAAVVFGVLLSAPVVFRKAKSSN